MPERSEIPRAERWARFRFSVIGSLLSAPPERGHLSQEPARLASKSYQHPPGGRSLLRAFHPERWYYAAREAADPLGALRNRLRKGAGEHPSVRLLLREAIRAQHREHPGWSYQLHGSTRRRKLPPPC
jgi:putative transposase